MVLDQNGKEFNVTEKTLHMSRVSAFDLDHECGRASFMWDFVVSLMLITASQTTTPTTTTANNNQPRPQKQTTTTTHNTTTHNNNNNTTTPATTTTATQQQQHNNSTTTHKWPGLTQWLSSLHHRLRLLLLLEDGHPLRVGVGLPVPTSDDVAASLGIRLRKWQRSLRWCGTILCLAATMPRLRVSWWCGSDVWNESWNRWEMCLCPRS